MESTNKILDAFHAMNVVIQKDLHAGEGEILLLEYTAEERAQLCARISHLFQGNMSPVLPSEPGVTYHVVLASSMKLEYPLYDALPNTTNSRDRLLAKIFQYRRNAASAEEGTSVATDEDYEMLYAYTLVTGQIAEEIKRVEKEVEDLFGILDEEVLTLQ